MRTLQARSRVVMEAAHGAPNDVEMLLRFSQLPSATAEVAGFAADAVFGTRHKASVARSPIPPDVSDVAWAQPYSIRSFLYQASRRGVA